MLVRNLKGKLFHRLKITSSIYSNQKVNFSDSLDLKKRIQNQEASPDSKTNKNLKFIDQNPLLSQIFSREYSKYKECP